jgi:formyltetrahydrofolate synthetase
VHQTRRRCGWIACLNACCLAADMVETRHQCCKRVVMSSFGSAALWCVQVSRFVRLDIDPDAVMWRRVVDINDRWGGHGQTYTLLSDC